MWHGLRIALALAVTCAAFVQLAAAQELRGPRLVEALRQGGHVIYFRHFETGSDTADQHRVTLGDCATQRQLNVAGAIQGVRTRNAFVALAIPVGEVLASPFCRAWQSADLAFGRHRLVEGLRLPPSETYTDADRAAMRAALVPILAAAPRAGTNTVVMAHDDNMPAAGGPEIPKQGNAVIVRPDGRGGFTVVAQVEAEFWRAMQVRLAGSAGGRAERAR
jgi:hypothetical protein